MTSSASPSSSRTSESLLRYAARFCHHQFLTREKATHEVLARVEELLLTCCNGSDPATRNLPAVQQLTDCLHLLPKRLSSLLRVLTGQNTQQHMHDWLLAKAKEKLSTTNLTVSEIAYQVGFEHLQPFSKSFKTKTGLSPLEWRASVL